ncbi:hypothetical protein GIB67_033219 [Kingdonia uniflora]|uniref:Late embryogenesis abundant protein LEA-2 subgroup domain-containing protein n=1 Tax=Kingdonia uniflora TaxID=39325 RepID=A0A7J7MPN2_9MAGN|nr:hypothetical protein GIB67_033219 [Kingdonia uniflora]
MMRANSTDSDITSYAPSSPLSPKKPNYYVQSPSSRDSHDDDKRSSSNATPTYNSPMESPSHSLGPTSNSRPSSDSRVSGPFRYSSATSKGYRKRVHKGWPECDVIHEEHAYDDDEPYDESQSLRHCQGFIAVVAFITLFSLFTLVLWGASLGYKPEIDVKSLSVSSFYFGTGVDYSGVPTKLMTANCSLKLDIHNHATFFGIHVSSTGFNLMFSKIIVATGQLKKYYQPRKSKKRLYVILEGIKVPLYGAGTSLVVSESIGNISLKLEFEI